MNTAKKILLYALYTLGVTGLFLYILFPSDSVRSYVGYQVNQADPTLEMTIDSVAPALPPGLTLRSALLLRNSEPVAGASRMTVTPALTTLFGPEIALTFRGDAYGGGLKGALVLDRSRQRPDPPVRSLEANLAGIQVGQLHALEQVPDYTLSGTLNAAVSYQRTDTGETGDIRLAVSDLTVRPRTPLFNITDVTFNQVQAEAILSPGRRLEIRKCSLAGPQVNGVLSGAIRIADDPAKSRLDLAGSLKPHPGFLADIGKGFPASLLLKNRSEISFRIRGTFEDPAFSLL